MANATCRANARMRLPSLTVVGLIALPAMQLVLTQSRALRFASFSAFYFAQGVPIGLLTVAIPPWLAEQGASQGDIGVYLGWVTLPWALKLIAGPFMDRFTFLPMGFRRPWVIALQGGLVLSLLLLALVGAGFGHGGGSLALLTVAGMVVNTFSATQDVAVDGMAIDVLPEGERGRANAYMGFGQAAARSTLGAACGVLLTVGGIAAGALACAGVVSLVFVWAALVRERPRDRLLPWSAGGAAPVARAKGGFFANAVDFGKALFVSTSAAKPLMQDERRAGRDKTTQRSRQEEAANAPRAEAAPLAGLAGFLSRRLSNSPMIANSVAVGRMLVLPMSLIAVAVEFLARLRDGFALVVFPIVATGELGFSTEEYTRFVGIVGLVAATLVILAGPYIDRFGAKRMLIIALSASGAVHLVAWAVPSVWADTDIVLALYCVLALLEQLTFVAIIALFMNLCSAKVAATQFAVYMALANLSRSAGSLLVAALEDHLQLLQNFFVMGGLLLLSAVVLSLFNAPAHLRRLAAFATASSSARQQPNVAPSSAAAPAQEQRPR